MFHLSHINQLTNRAIHSSATQRSSERINPNSTGRPGQRQMASPIQRALGNVAMQSSSVTKGPLVQRTCACGGRCTSCSANTQASWNLQPKLTVGPAHDVYEQEADRVADSVMRMPTTTRNQNQKPTHIHIQRRVASSAQTDPTLPEVTLPSSTGQPLSPSTRQYMEPRFGTDFSHVRVHTNQAAQDTASHIQAKAFTHGPNIWLGKGANESDKRLMAHELTHVVQQGAAHPSTEGGPTTSLDEDPCDIQRESKSRCPDGIKTVTVDLVSLRGSTRNPPADLDFANTIYRPCCVQFQMGTGVTVSQSDSDTWLGGDTAMSRGTTRGAIHAEQTATYDGATAVHNLTSRVRAFYVESLVGGSRATSFPATWATGAAAPYTDMVIVTNSAMNRTLAHEFGHLLLNADGSVHRTHPGGTDNLMQPSSSATGENLEPSQCTTIYSNA